jgi:hypothetical protein
MTRCDYICGPWFFQLHNCLENNSIAKIMGSLCKTYFSYDNYWIYQSFFQAGVTTTKKKKHAENFSRVDLEMRNGEC